MHILEFQIFEQMQNLLILGCLSVLSICIFYTKAISFFNNFVLAVSFKTFAYWLFLLIVHFSILRHCQTMHLQQIPIFAKNFHEQNYLNCKYLWICLLQIYMKKTKYKTCSHNWKNLCFPYPFLLMVFYEWWRAGVIHRQWHPIPPRFPNQNA